MSRGAVRIRFFPLSRGRKVDMGAKRIVILGSTGSIGRQTLDIVRTREDLQVIGLAGGGNLGLLAQQVREFRPALVSFRREGVLDPAPVHPVCYCSLEEMAGAPEADIVVIGTVGKAGLLPTLAALRAGKAVALANKEVLVMAGSLVQQAAAEHGGILIPVDSEHSAIWQCLLGEPGSPWPEIKRLLLTASGGAFRDLPLSALADVTPEQALHHPTWNMGPKITVDSATLMNKGFEVIEARWLFGYSWDQIDVIMHRESIVHSMVEFPDGSFKAQLGLPDMRLPLQYAFTYPARHPIQAPLADWSVLRSLTFEALDMERYPCLGLALEAARRGGTYPAVLSAADETAVARFLAGASSFTGIHAAVSGALERHTPVANPTLEDVLEADGWARRYVAGLA